MDDTQQSLSFYWSRSVFDLKFFSVQVVSSFQALCAEAIYDLQAEIVETRLLVFVVFCSWGSAGAPRSKLRAR